jgi:hypothetical protein
MISVAFLQFIKLTAPYFARIITEMNHSFYRIAIICLLSLGLYNCNNQNADSSETKASSATAIQTTSPPVFEKLLGTWQLENGKTYERWKKNNDGTYRSDVYVLKGADTSWNEQAHIYPENDRWVFENRINGQNDDKSVKFTSDKLTDNSVQFSNPAHDFPTDVNYTISDQNSVNAFIVGPNSKGGKDTIPFKYKRFL